jgi:heme A synthase
MRLSRLPDEVVSWFAHRANWIAWIVVVMIPLGVMLYAASAAHAAPRWARDGGWLPRHDAQAQAVQFIGLQGPLLDTPEASDRVTERVSVPSKCHRRDHATVLCWFSVHLASRPMALRGFMLLHLQRNGLIGVKLPWDPLRVGLGYY